MNTDNQIADEVDRHFGQKTVKGRYKCDFDGCTRTFDSPVGLRMHRIRGHISPWSTTGNFGNAKKRRERRLALMRITSKRARARNIAKGLTGGGYERKTQPDPERPRWKSKAYRRMKYDEQVARYHAAGLNAHGQPFKNNKLSKAMQRVHGAIGTRPRGKSGRMMPYVFPVPGSNAAPQNLAQLTEPTRPMVAEMNYCPHCGEHLARWKHNA